MDFEHISRSLLPLLGGKENIASAAHCATRLRLVLVDDSLADKKAIGEIEGVKGCFNNAGQMQIIFGTGIVNKVYAAFIQVAGIGESSKVGSRQYCGEKAQPVPAHCAPAVEHLRPYYSGYRRLRPADGPAGDGKNLRLGRSE
ncbi:PTS system sac EIIBC component [Raoultella terrigena]|uniref:PTS system sac EIIBC component n=1 Tax=Raoultella terrigena TaxID=577 RepID=A0A485B676_RAOTE|nr:PTS system sac EIIBC component [Raoultella terrigena]